MMLDVSRSATAKVAGNKIQPIEHPLIKMTKDNLLEMSLNPVTMSLEEGRSIAFEDKCRYTSKRGNTSRISSRGSKTEAEIENFNSQGVFLTNIPDSVSVVSGDNNTTRLPIFGNRSAIQMRSTTSSRQGSTKLSEKISVDEMSERFQKKLSGNYYEVRKRFIDNDPDRNGNVHKEALKRILQTFIGCEITNNGLNGLLDLWGFKTDKQMFSFAEINAIFVNKLKEKGETNFIDPISRPKPKSIVPSKMIAADVFELLKERFRLRTIYLSDLFPDFVESQTFNFNKTDLKNALYKLMIDLVPTEMDKLWAKFDPTKQNSIDGLKFLKQMGIISCPTMSFTPRIRASTDVPKHQDSVKSLENLLKLKLREGFTTFSKDFQKKDVNQKGYVSKADFLQVLSDHNLNLEEKNLNEFLNQCIIIPSKDGIPYKEFLIRFQDRSEAGIAHKLLTGDDTRKSLQNEIPLNQMSLVEMKLINIFQKDFLELLENFRKYDKYGNCSIEISDFRKVLENKMNVKFTEPQFKTIVDNLPLNRNNTVSYLDFLKQFDSGTFSPISFDDQSNICDEPQQSESQKEVDFDEMKSDKSLIDIKNAIKKEFETRYSEIEKAFNDLDECNNKVLTQELMYQLMKKLNIRPELSRGDIRSLWKIFILNERKQLEFKEFTRHFMYNKLTASFPNAKLNPPVKGDSDLMQRSKKLNAATDLLLDNLRSKIDFMYNELQMEFADMDKENTGEVSVEDFREILKELCIRLTDYEIETVCEKFKTSNNRIAYTELLKPFGAHKKSQSKERTNIENQHKSLQTPITQPKEKILSKTFQEKLNILIQPSMRRNIKKLDYSNSGLMSVFDLRNLLLQEGVVLSEEETYNLMSTYDKNLVGSIDYKLLLKELQSNV